MHETEVQYLTLPGPNGKQYEINVGIQMNPYWGPTTHISDTSNLNPSTIPAKEVDVVVDMYGQPGQVVNFHNSIGPYPLTRFVPLHPQTLETPAVVTMERVQPVIVEGLANPPGIPPGS